MGHNKNKAAYCGGEYRPQNFSAAGNKEKKMKKPVTCVISAACVCALALGIAACGDGENTPAHTHELDKVDAVSATFFENGNREYYTCDCGKFFSDSEGKNEIQKDSWVIAAVGTTADAFDAFTVYNSKSTKGTKGIVCNLDTDANAGPATYFGEADKNLEWDGRKTTIGFMLDLSELKENDFTIWDLSFNKKEGDEFKNTAEYELRFGIAKTAKGFVVCDLFVPGVTFNAETDLAEILKSDKTFDESTVSVSFEAAIDEGNVMTYAITVGDVKMEGEGTFTCDVVGFRTLWNAFMNQNGVEAYNFTRS